MRLNELVNQRQADAKVEQAWDAWDSQIEQDLENGALKSQIMAAHDEADKAEAL